MTRQGYQFIIGALAFASAIHILSWMVQSCSGSFVLKALADSAAGSCGELWLNRYQSLLAGVIAIFGAWLTIRAMRQQTEAARGDAAIKQLSEYSAVIAMIMGRYNAVEPREQPNATSEKREIAIAALRERLDDPVVLRALNDPLLGGDATALALFMNATIGAALYPRAGDTGDGPAHLVWPLYIDLTDNLAKRREMLVSGKPTAYLFRMAQINQRKYRKAYISRQAVDPDE